MYYNLEFVGYWPVPSSSKVDFWGGIYCIYAVKDKDPRLLYVGEAEEIEASIANHKDCQKWEKEADGQDLYFSAAHLNPDTGRQRAQAALVYRHRPPCNLEVPEHFKYDVKLLTSGANACLDPYFIIRTNGTSSVPKMIATPDEHLSYGGASRVKSVRGKTTRPGYINENGQITIRNTGLPGNHQNQKVYQIGCSRCGLNYGANGCDIFERKCPRCGDGEDGIPFCDGSSGCFTGAKKCGHTPASDASMCVEHKS